MSPSKRTPNRRPTGAAPVMLPTFFIGTAAMVVAVVAIGRSGSDLADVGAFALLLALAGLLMVAIAHRLRDEPPTDESEPDAPNEDRT